MQIYCPKCECDRDVIIKNISESYNVRGENILLDFPCYICSFCGESISAIDGFGDPIEHVYAKYCQNNGITMEDFFSKKGLNKSRFDEYKVLEDEANRQRMLLASPLRRCMSMSLKDLFIEAKSYVKKVLTSKK